MHKVCLLLLVLFVHLSSRQTNQYLYLIFVCVVYVCLGFFLTCSGCFTISWQIYVSVLKLYPDVVLKSSPNVVLKSSPNVCLTCLKKKAEGWGAGA